MESKPITERTEWLLQLSQKHADEYVSPEAALARKLYLAKHPTRLFVFKCMDGRIHMPHSTQTPLGIMTPFRNLGGMFDLGWPHLGEVVSSSVLEAVEQGYRAVLIITYHFSKSSKEHGCAGFNYDTGAAFEHVLQIREQAETIYGDSHQTVYPVIWGIETDEDALILHNKEGQVLNMAEVDDDDSNHLFHAVKSLYPDMNQKVVLDLLPLLEGNLRQIRKNRKEPRESGNVHREWMMCIGRGFDFLHEPNIALIVGPYSPDLVTPIAKAAHIIENNMKLGRIPDDGFLLLASTPYREFGSDKARAQLKTKFLADFATHVIEEQAPELAKKMVKKTGVLNWNTRQLDWMN